MPKLSPKAAAKALAKLEARRWSELSPAERQQYHVLQARIGTSHLDEARAGQLAASRPSRALSDWERQQLGGSAYRARAATLRQRAAEFEPAPRHRDTPLGPEHRATVLTIHEPMGGYATPITHSHSHPSGPAGMHGHTHSHRGEIPANHGVNTQDHRHGGVDVMASDSATKGPLIPSVDGTSGTGVKPRPGTENLSYDPTSI